MTDGWVVPDLTDVPIGRLVSLAGRRAVVTGGASGLGRAIARRFAEAGATVLVGDLDEPGARRVASDLRGAFGGSALGAGVDVRDTASVVALADRAVNELGGLHVWVNCAGIFPDTAVLEMPDEEWDRVISVNLRGAFVGSREAANRMVAADHGGVIINIASTAAFKALAPRTPHYVASKHGLRGLTASMGLELAPRGIRVLAIAPTVILTPGVEAKIAASVTDPALAARRVQSLDSLLGRPGVPDDVARVALFCASDLAAFMTGSTLPVDAGDLTR